MDETYIKTKANGFILPLISLATLLTSCCPKNAIKPQRLFLKQAIDYNGFPKKVVIEKSGANFVGLENINLLLMLSGIISFVEILQIKYLNNLV
jgi:transposase-like protein